MLYVIKKLVNKIVLFLIQEISTYRKILSMLKTNGDPYFTNILAIWLEKMEKQPVQALDLLFIYQFLDFWKSINFTELILVIIFQSFRLSKVGLLIDYSFLLPKNLCNYSLNYLKRVKNVCGKKIQTRMKTIIGMLHLKIAGTYVVAKEVFAVLAIMEVSKDIVVVKMAKVVTMTVQYLPLPQFKMTESTMYALVNEMIITLKVINFICCKSIKSWVNIFCRIFLKKSFNKK